MAFRLAIGVAFVFALSLTSYASQPNVAAVCQQAGDDAAGDFAKIYNKLPNYPAGIIQTGSADAITSALIAFCWGSDDCIAQAPWILLNSSRAEVRLGMYEVQKFLANQYLKRTGYASDADSVLQLAASRPAQYSAATAPAVAAVISAVRSNSTNKIAQELAKVKPWVSGLCINFLDVECPAALQEVLNLAQVGTLATDIDGKTSTDLTAMDAVQTLFSDPRYVQGLAIAAQTIEQKVNGARAGQPVVGDFLSDLEAGYVQAGYDAASAEDLTYTFLAYFGARGASVEYTSDLTNSENYPILVASYVINSAVEVLDFYSLASGHPYSVPKKFRTSCSYGRPYHFWLSAYLARKLVQDGHPARSAKIAVHIVSVGYEAAAGTVTRVPYLPLTVPQDDLGNQSIRLNIAMDDAGAEFGAGLNPIDGNTDDRIARLLQSKDHFSPVSTAQAEDLFNQNFLEYVLDWNEIFHPDDGFLFFELE